MQVKSLEAPATDLPAGLFQCGCLRTSRGLGLATAAKWAKSRSLFGRAKLWMSASTTVSDGFGVARMSLKGPIADVLSRELNLRRPPRGNPWDSSFLHQTHLYMAKNLDPFRRVPYAAAETVRFHGSLPAASHGYDT